MPLKAGTRLGPYEISSAMGAGGMGEVYRARDTRLDRTVAVKVLPRHLSDDPSFRQRFEREAKLLSSLNHPNICTLYDVGQHDGTDYLVMEYMEGETLGKRLERGALPLEQALRIAVQIADALDKAHRQGLIHRDLKPGNIMLTKAAAKLLDFGLAKSMLSAPAVSSVAATVSSPITAEGMIVGTFQYMSPEQLEGKEADGRSDVFSFGAVLYETLTGRKAFPAKSQASLIAAILEHDPPPVTEIVAMTPPALDRLVRICLAKDTDERYQSMHDVLLQLRWIAEGGSGAGVPAPAVARRANRERVAWATAVIALLVTAGTIWLSFGAPVQDKAPARFSISMPEGVRLVEQVEEHNMAVSPDGRMLAIVVSSEGRQRLWLRPLGVLEAKPVPDTEGAVSPFWSPDGRYIAFFAGGKLKKVPADGGPVQIICATRGDNAGSWGSRGNILFTEFQGRPGIFQVPATGGEPALLALMEPEGTIEFRWPHWLPDGEHFLFLGFGKGDKVHLAVGSSTTGAITRLLPVVSRAEYAAPGYLLFVRNRTLMAQPFDTRSLQLSGEATPLAEKMPYFLTGWAPFTVSSHGELFFQSGDSPSELTWMDRKGTVVGKVGERAFYQTLSLSPDQKKVVVEIADPGENNSDLWIYDLARGTGTRFTAAMGHESRPSWSRDGTQIAFGVHGLPDANLYAKKVGEAGDGQPYAPPVGNFQFPWDWSPDGRFLTYNQYDVKTGWDAWLLPLNGERQPIPLIQTAFNEGEVRFSPDGRWIAFFSDESGRSEVYVQPFPGPGERVRVSAAGGDAPEWVASGKELLYVSAAGELMSVPVQAKGKFTFGNAVALFSVQRSQAADLTYGVAARGDRFLFITGGGPESLPITAVLNWAQELKKR